MVLNNQCVAVLAESSINNDMFCLVKYESDTSVLFYQTIR